MFKLLSILWLTFMLSACAGTATEPAEQSNQTVAASSETEEDKVVCRRQQSTGFRLKTRICKPASEW